MKTKEKGLFRLLINVGKKFYIKFNLKSSSVKDMCNYLSNCHQYCLMIIWFHLDKPN